MIGEKMVKAFNGQVNAELYSSYLYLSMSAFFASKGMPGAAYWMKVQALEELYHATKMSGYVQARQGRAIMETIEKPPVEWESAQAVFQHVYDHERKVTGLIKDLAKVAEDEGDKEAREFIQWYLKEQEEEEESSDEVLKLVKDAGADLAKADTELAARTFKIPKDVTIKFRNPPGT